MITVLAPPAMVTGTFTYASTIDPAITDLYARYAYPPNMTDLPVVIVMHGFTQQVSDFDAAAFVRMARHGLFVCAVGMRGRDSAGGTQDAGAREVHDIYDAIADIRTDFASVVSSTLASIVGYSGGGGNAIACAAKFPDAFTDIVSHFGMSDYGYDATYGWHQQNASYRATLESWIGGDPTTVPNNYYARAHVQAVGNFTSGHIFVFHDDDDASVNKNQSTRVIDTMVAAGLTNYTARYTSSANSTRWLHALPGVQDPVRWTEDVWGPIIARKTHAAWTVPASGTIKVMGYIVTKRFTIWLGDGTAEAADVTYNTATDTYTVTPLTGTMTVTITQGAKTVSQEITAETALVVV